MKLASPTKSCGASAPSRGGGAEGGSAVCGNGRQKNKAAAKTNLTAWRLIALQVPLLVH